MPTELHKWASVQPKTSVAFQHAKVLLDNQVSCRSLQREHIVEDLVSLGLTKVAAGDLLEEFRTTNDWGDVGIFWDLENVAFTSSSATTPSQVISAIRGLFSRFNTARVVEFNAYCDQMCAPQSDAVREALHSASVRVIDTPHIRRKEVADKTIITDAMDFAFNQKTDKQVTVCLVTGDGDFAHTLAKLRSRGVKTVVLHTTDNTAALLISGATHAQTLASLCHHPSIPNLMTASSPKATTPSPAAAASKISTPPSDKKARKSPPLPPSPSGNEIEAPVVASPQSARKIAHPALPIAPTKGIPRMSVAEMVQGLTPSKEREVTLQQLYIRLEEMVPKTVLDATLRHFEAKFTDIDDIIYMLDTDGELRLEFGMFMVERAVKVGRSSR